MTALRRLATDLVLVADGMLSPGDPPPAPAHVCAPHPHRRPLRAHVRRRPSAPVPVDHACTTPRLAREASGDARTPAR